MSRFPSRVRLFSSSSRPHAARTLPISRPRSKRTDDHQPDQQQLPRFIRRANTFKAPYVGPQKNHDPITALPSGPDELKSQPQQRYRSKHFDPSIEKPKASEIRFLEPHTLSARLKKLCDGNKIDQAVDMLKNAPLDAQNTPVWNTLIWESMKARRFQLAYQLFVDMKRRGFAPSTRTFQTLFSGLSRVTSWSQHPKQLSNVRSIYQSFLKHMTSIARHDPHSTEITVTPLAAYIKILGDAGRFQEMFDVYEDLMDERGAGGAGLTPNEFIYTAMFQALASKHPHVDPDQHPSAASSQSSLEEAVAAQNAVSARLLWQRLVKSICGGAVVGQQKQMMTIDSHILAAALSALARAPSHSSSSTPVQVSAEHALGLSIISTYLGLTPPGVRTTTTTTAKTSSSLLTPQTLYAALALTNAAGKPEYTIHYFEQIKKWAGGQQSSATTPSLSLSVLDRGHVEEVLKAYVALARVEAWRREKTPLLARLSGGGGGKETVDDQTPATTTTTTVTRNKRLVTPSEGAYETLTWALRMEQSVGPRLRPALTTFGLVLSACRENTVFLSSSSSSVASTGEQGDEDTQNQDEAVAIAESKGIKGDWETALKTFEVLSGYKGKDFEDGGWVAEQAVIVAGDAGDAGNVRSSGPASMGIAALPTPPRVRRTAGRNLDLNVDMAGTLVQTVLGLGAPLSSSSPSPSSPLSSSSSSSSSTLAQSLERQQTKKRKREERQCLRIVDALGLLLPLSSSSSAKAKATVASENPQAVSRLAKSVLELTKRCLASPSPSSSSPSSPSSAERTKEADAERKRWVALGALAKRRIGSCAVTRSKNGGARDDGREASFIPSAPSSEASYGRREGVGRGRRFT